jgi:hypothetical protein
MKIERQASISLLKGEGFMSATQWETVLAMPVTQGRDHIQGPADAG